jgi:hypothetical protein
MTYDLLDLVSYGLRAALLWWVMCLPRVLIHPYACTSFSNKHYHVNGVLSYHLSFRRISDRPDRIRFDWDPSFGVARKTCELHRGDTRQWKGACTTPSACIPLARYVPFTSYPCMGYAGHMTPCRHTSYTSESSRCSEPFRAYYTVMCVTDLTQFWELDPPSYMDTELYHVRHPCGHGRHEQQLL